MHKAIIVKIYLINFKLLSSRISSTLILGPVQQGGSIGVRAGGRGGLQPPQSLGNSDFLGSKRKFGQSQFSKTFPCFLFLILF